MTPSLPPKPSLRFLKEQAKDLLKARKAGDASCCAVLRNLARFAAATNADILAAEVPLKEVQFALAMHYGFKSWDELRQAVDHDSEGAAGTLSLGDIKLLGNLMVEDVFCLTVQAGVKLVHDIDIDYEALHALSTNAYCLGIAPGENCMSWWHHAGRALASDLVGQRCGLTFQRLRIEGLSVHPGMSGQEWNRTTEEQMQRFPALFRKVMADGGIVIVDGGWKGGSGLIPWVHWGIITVAEEGKIFGASFNGRNDNGMEYIDGCWSVFPVEPSLSEAQADREMLRRAVLRIRAAGPDFGPDHPRGLAFGLRGMDLWIRQMRDVRGFCPSCFEEKPDRGGDAIDPAQTLVAGARSVSGYLRKRIPSLPNVAARPLRAVVAHYDAIAGIVGPFVDDPALYKAFIGDLDKQKEHADTVLVPIKNELAAAASEIEKALLAME